MDIAVSVRPPPAFNHNSNSDCHTPVTETIATFPERESGGRVANYDRSKLMRILIATDAWRPQVNGVVSTLTALARSAAGLGDEIQFVSPEGFPSVAVPTYPGLRVALPNRREIAARIEAAAPEAIHIEIGRAHV